MIPDSHEVANRLRPVLLHLNRHLRRALLSRDLLRVQDCGYLGVRYGVH